MLAWAVLLIAASRFDIGRYWPQRRLAPEGALIAIREPIPDPADDEGVPWEEGELSWQSEGEPFEEPQS